jgi:hypothetical protein
MDYFRSALQVNGLTLFHRPGGHTLDANSPNHDLYYSQWRRLNGIDASFCIPVALKHVRKLTLLYGVSLPFLHYSVIVQVFRNHTLSKIFSKI